MQVDGGRLWFSAGLDNSQLEADAARSRELLRGIGRAAEGEGARMDGAFRRIGASLAAALSVPAAAAFARSVVEVRGQIEALEMSFETLLGSQQASAELMGGLRGFATDSGMQLGHVAKGAETLLAFNVAAEDVVPTLRQIGDITGGDAQRFQSLALAFSQMSSTGRLMGQDLLQMINAGFNPLVEISERTGQSVSELKAQMEAGGISVQMVADAFASAAGEGGRFHGMLEKRAQGIQGGIARLRGAFEDMLNEVGQGSEGVIRGVTGGLTVAVENYRRLGEAVAAVVAVYGTYRAALMATEAVAKSRAAISRAAEIAELRELVSAEGQARVSKLGLVEGSAAHQAALRGELEAQVRGAQAARETARVELQQSARRVRAKRQELAASRELLAQRERELAQARAAGSAKGIEAAQRRVAAAASREEAAAAAMQGAMRDRMARQAALTTATTAANTAATAANGVAQRASARSVGLLTVAKGKLQAVIKRVNAALMANPYAIAAAAVAALAYGVYKLVTHQTEAERAQGRLNAAMRASEEAIAAETHQMDALFGRLRAAKEGTQEYADAKNAILSRYGEYLRHLGDEKDALNDIAAAYEAVRRGVQQAARERIYQELVSKESELIAKREREAFEAIQGVIEGKLKGSDAFELAFELKPYIEGDKVLGEMEAELEGRLAQFSRRVATADGMGGLTYMETNPILDILHDMGRAQAQYRRSVDEANRYISRLTSREEIEAAFDASAATLGQLNERAMAARESLARLRVSSAPDASAIAAQEGELAALEREIALRERNLTVIREVEGQIAHLQKLQKETSVGSEEFEALSGRIAALQSRLPAAARGGHGALLADAEGFYRQMADLVARGEEEVASARIDGLEDGLEKELARVEFAHARRLQAIAERERELVSLTLAARQAEWRRQGEEGAMPTESTVGRADLTARQRAMLSAQLELAERAREEALSSLYAAEHATLEKALAEVRTYEEQRVAIMAEYAERRAMLVRADGSLRSGVSAAHLAELEAQEVEALRSLEGHMMGRSGVFRRIFSDISAMSREEIREAVRMAEEALSTLTDPEHLARLQDRIVELRDAVGGDGGRGFDLDFRRVLLSLKKLAEYRRLSKEYAAQEGEENQRMAEQYERLAERLQGETRRNMAAIGVDAFVEGLGMAVERMRELADLTGDVQLGDTADRLGSLVQNLQAAGQGASQGGWIGAIVGGGMDMINQTVDSFMEWEASAARARMDQLDFMHEMEQASARLKGSDYDSVFGTRALLRAQDAAKKAGEAMAAFQREVSARDVPSQERERRSDGALAFTGFLYLGKRITAESKGAMEAYEKGYNNLQGMQIKTRSRGKWAKFWGAKDEYTSLRDLAPQIWDAQGEFNVEAAEAFLKTNNQISDEQRAQLQNVVNLRRAYEENLKVLDETVASFAGGLAAPMADAIWEGVVNGGADAWERWGEIGAEAIADLGKQMIQELIISAFLDNYKEDLRRAFGGGDTGEVAAIIGQMTRGLPGLYEQAVAATQEFAAASARAGVDLQKRARRTAERKGIAAASQDSIDELNGRMTAVQGHTFEIAATTRQLGQQASRILGHLAGIERNTLGLSRLEAIEADMAAVRRELSDIAVKGIRVRD